MPFDQGQTPGAFLDLSTVPVKFPPTVANNLSFLTGLGVNNVLFNGAKGDGVTDDSASIQATINLGGVTLFPIGTYNIGGASIVVPPGAVLLGVKGAKIVGTGDPMFSVSGDAAGIMSPKPHVEKLWFASGATNKIFRLSQTSLLRSQSARFIDCIFDGSANTNTAAVGLVTLDYMWGTTFDRCHFVCAGQPSITTFQTYAVNSRSCYGTTLNLCYLYNFGYGVVSQRSSIGAQGLDEGPYIHDCHFLFCNTAIYLSQCYNFLIDGCNIDNNYNVALWIGQNPAGGDNVSAGQIIGNNFGSVAAAGAGLACVRCEGSSSIDFIGNQITHNNQGNIGVQVGTYAAYGSGSGNNTWERNTIIGVTKLVNGFLFGPGIGQGNSCAGNKINTSLGLTGLAIAYDAGSISANFGFPPSLTLKDNIGNNSATTFGNGGTNPIGPIGPPAFPATGVTLWNPYPYAVDIYLAGAGITIVKVVAPGAGPAQTGIVNGTVHLEPGDGINVTYTGSPSWVWKAN